MWLYYKADYEKKNRLLWNWTDDSDRKRILIFFTIYFGYLFLKLNPLNIRHDPLFEQTRISLTEEWFVLRSVEIGPVDLKIFEICQFNFACSLLFSLRIRRDLSFQQTWIHPLNMDALWKDLFELAWLFWRKWICNFVHVICYFVIILSPFKNGMPLHLNKVHKMMLCANFFHLSCPLILKKKIFESMLFEQSWILFTKRCVVPG